MRGPAAYRFTRLEGLGATDSLRGFKRGDKAEPDETVRMRREPTSDRGEGVQKSKLLVFTTSYNECQNIAPLIDQIAEAVPAADILVVDDNSPDGTWDIIQAKAAQYPRLPAL